MAASSSAGRMQPACACPPRRRVLCRAASAAPSEAAKLEFGTLTWVRKEDYMRSNRAADSSAGPRTAEPLRPRRAVKPQSGQTVSVTPLLLARSTVAQAAAQHMPGTGLLVGLLCCAAAVTAVAGVLRLRATPATRAQPPAKGDHDRPRQQAPPTKPASVEEDGRQQVVQRVPYNEHLVVVEDNTQLSDEEVERLSRDLGSNVGGRTLNG